MILQLSEGRRMEGPLEAIDEPHCGDDWSKVEISPQMSALTNRVLLGS